MINVPVRVQPARGLCVWRIDKKNGALTAQVFLNEAKSVALSIQRGKDRVRVETKILLPKREELITARIQGSYLADEKEIMIISRNLTQIRVRIPAHWTPVSVTWNGFDMLKTESAGCWTLSIEKDPPEAVACQ